MRTLTATRKMLVVALVLAFAGYMTARTSEFPEAMKQQAAGGLHVDCLGHNTNANAGQTADQDGCRSKMVCCHVLAALVQAFPAPGVASSQVDLSTQSLPWRRFPPTLRPSGGPQLLQYHLGHQAPPPALHVTPIGHSGSRACRSERPANDCEALPIRHARNMCIRVSAVVGATPKIH